MKNLWRRWRSSEAREKRRRRRNPAMAAVLDIFDEIDKTAQGGYVYPTREQLERIQLLLRVMQ